MARTRWSHIFMLTAALVAFGVALVVPGLDVGVLFLSPAIVLLASLLTGHYVGEERLHRLVANFRSRPRAAGVRVAATASLRRRALMPRGGRLVATSLAVRPPPLLPAAR
jgi:hypothetical protein